MQLFKISSTDIIQECCVVFDAKSVSDLILNRRCKFLIKFVNKTLADLIKHILQVSNYDKTCKNMKLSWLQAHKLQERLYYIYQKPCKKSCKNCTTLADLIMFKTTQARYKYMHSKVHSVAIGIFRPPVYGSNGRTYKMLVMFFFRHAFSEFPRPIALKLCNLIGICVYLIMQVQKLGGHSPKKNWGPKICKILVDF